jgi:hypothetical protein
VCDVEGALPEHGDRAARDAAPRTLRLGLRRSWEAVRRQATMAASLASPGLHVMTSRALNIALRTAHVGAMGVLLGGHAFDVEPSRLHVALGLTIATGLALAAHESGGRLLWFHQGRGILTLVKLALLCLVPFAWDHRFPILLGVLVLGSVGAHMSSRYRYYSVIHRAVIPHGCGPGVERLRQDRREQDGVQSPEPRTSED